MGNLTLAAIPELKRPGLIEGPRPAAPVLWGRTPAIPELKRPGLIEGAAASGGNPSCPTYSRAETPGPN